MLHKKAIYFIICVT